MTKPSPERQQELIEAYKKTPKLMGVYCIRNLQNNHRYIASSRDLRARFNRHQMELKMNADRSSPQLQADYNALGRDLFDFEILEELAPLDTPNYDPTEDLELLESEWLQKLEPYAPNGYNRTP